MAEKTTLTSQEQACIPKLYGVGKYGVLQDQRKERTMTAGDPENIGSGSGHRESRSIRAAGLPFQHLVEQMTVVWSRPNRKLLFMEQEDQPTNHPSICLTN